MSLTTLLHPDTLSKKGFSKEDAGVWLFYIVMIFISVGLITIARENTVSPVFRIIAVLAVFILPVILLARLKKATAAQDEYMKSLIFRSLAGAAISGLMFPFTIICLHAIMGDIQFAGTAPIIAPYFAGFMAWSTLRRTMNAPTRSETI